MKRILTTLYLAVMSMLLANAQQSKTQQYTLISVVKKTENGHKPYKIAVVDQKTVAALSEPLKALAAYYCCGVQSGCESDNAGNVTCDLNSALGLGKVGSDKQIAILKKWFPGDKITQSAIDENCWVGIPGSSSFAEYDALIFRVHSDTVTINYQYAGYSHGSTSVTKKTEIACIRGNKIVFIKR